MSKEATFYRVKPFSDWARFLKQAKPLLLEREVESNLTWEVGRVSADQAGLTRPWSAWLVLDGKKPVLSALPSVTEYLILSAGHPGACAALADFLSAKSHSLKGVSGPEPVSEVFADAWAEQTGKVSNLGASLSFYLASSDPEFASEVAGGMRLARVDEGDKLRGWAIDFVADSAHPMDPRVVTRLSENMMGRRDLFVWEASGEVVAMGGFGRETPNGLVVNMVYTPRNRRGRGYAGALTSGLVCEANARGKRFCCLYSDFSSSVRENLYERIGFQRIGDFAERSFTDQSLSEPSDRQ